jgi:hypothetical protein
MKKLIFAIIIFIFLASFVSADMIVSRQTCEDGLTFVIENTGGYQFRPKDFTIIGTHYTGKTVKFDGIWRNLADDPVLQTSGREFLSNNTVPYYGDYIINITRVEQIDEHILENGKSKVLFEESMTFPITCNEQAFECSKINLKIDDCYTFDDNYFGVFSGIGDQPGFNYKKFNFKFIGKGHLFENITPKKSQFGEIGPGKYFITFPVNSTTDWTIANINSCDQERFQGSAVRERCTLPKKCSADSECDSYEYCDIDNGGFCRIFLCSKCEIPINGTCVSKCNDKNICTEDSCMDDGSCKNAKIDSCCLNDSECGESSICETKKCTENKCQSFEKECTDTKDPCVLGKCSEEKKGCIYEVNPDCRISWLQKIIDWFYGFFR